MGGNETSFSVAFTILCVNVNAKQLNRMKSQGTGNDVITGDWE